MQKIFLIFLGLCILISSTSSNLYANDFMSFEESAGCEKTDPFLPTLVICGRNPASGVCPAYTAECTMGHLIETGRRILIWIITIVLLTIPLVIT